MKRQLDLDGIPVDDASDCYVIAEIGANHMGRVDICKDIIEAAKQCGANAVKLQRRDNRALYTRQLFESPYENRNSFGKTYGEHREFLEFSREQFHEINAFCEEIGITMIATAFDFTSADFLNELGLPFFKIASGDLTNTPLMSHIAGFGKPMIFSTGGGSMVDVERAYEAIAAINSQICIMQCTSGYPAEYEELNLQVIETYRNRFPDCVIGYSGHENGIAMPLVAYMLGARVVEKHFTLNRTWKGTDQVFSLTPEGMRKMIRDLRRTRIALGNADKAPLEIEAAPIRKMAKKLVAARDLPVGHKLTRADIAIKSPGDGLPPYELDRMIGRTVAKPLAADEGLSHETVEDRPTPTGAGT